MVEREVYEPQFILFPNGNRARAVHTPTAIDGVAILDALDLPPARAVLLIHGGAKNMSLIAATRLRRLIAELVIQIAAKENIMVIDGGTQVGVAEIVGSGRAELAGGSPLIGVCPRALISWTDDPSAQGLTPLEPNHTHFILTDGNRWGDEIEAMFALAAALSKRLPAIALLVNGGDGARKEVLYNVHQEREIIVLAGSGRLADNIAAGMKGNVQPPDSGISYIIEKGRLTFFDIDDEPEALAALLYRKLFRDQSGSASIAGSEQ